MSKHFTDEPVAKRQALSAERASSPFWPNQIRRFLAKIKKVSQKTQNRLKFCRSRYDIYIEGITAPRHVTHTYLGANHRIAQLAILQYIRLCFTVCCAFLLRPNEPSMNGASACQETTSSGCWTLANGTWQVCSSWLQVVTVETAINTLN